MTSSKKCLRWSKSTKESTLLMVRTGAGTPNPDILNCQKTVSQAEIKLLLASSTWRSTLATFARVPRSRSSQSKMEAKKSSALLTESSHTHLLMVPWIWPLTSSMIYLTLALLWKILTKSVDILSMLSNQMEKLSMQINLSWTERRRPSLWPRTTRLKKV